MEVLLRATSLTVLELYRMEVVRAMQQLCLPNLRQLLTSVYTTDKGIVRTCTSIGTTIHRSVSIAVARRYFVPQVGAALGSGFSPLC